MIAGIECIGIEMARAAEFERVARRNNSLSSTGRLLVFGFLFIVSVGIACAFAALGAWLILPFAGIEMLGLYWAFRIIDRHAADYERIAIAGDRVRVELYEAGCAQTHEFNRCWARVAASPDGGRVALRSHGREVEIGRHRNDDERLELARELGYQLRAAAH
jgi:uncharacterized membrane protein